MTLSSRHEDPPRCAYCRRPVPIRDGPGRPARYCRRSHRQRAFEARRRSAALQLGNRRVVVDRAELDRLHDRLYALEAALEDVDGDLAADRSAIAARRALDHLYEAAADLRGMVVEPAG